MKCFKTDDVFGVKCCMHTIAYPQYRCLQSSVCWFVKKQEVYDMWIWYNDYNILWYLIVYAICRKGGTMTQRLFVWCYQQQLVCCYHSVGSAGEWNSSSSYWIHALGICVMSTGDFFEVASVYNPNLCRVLFVDFVASNKSPVFFFRGKSLSRQFPFGSDRSGNKAEKLAPCDLLLFWTYSSLKIPLEICWKVDVFVCVSFNRCWSHQHSRGFFGDCPKAFGSWLLLVSLRIGCYQSSYVRSVRWQAFTVSLATLQTSHVMYSHWIVIVRPKR